MIDLAVGVIIGGAFGKIVSSLVDNIIMPTVAVIMPGQKGYEQWALHLQGNTIPYGKFLGDVVNFLIVSFALYLFVVRFVRWINSFQEKEKAAPVVLSKDQQLLTEILETLKRQERSAS